MKWENLSDYGLWTSNEVFFHRNLKLAGLCRQFWAYEFWGIWGVSGQFISIHFGTESPLSMFSINQLLFLQKLTFISRSQTFIWDWDLNLGRKKLGI